MIFSRSHWLQGVLLASGGYWDWRNATGFAGTTGIGEMLLASKVLLGLGKCYWLRGYYGDWENATGFAGATEIGEDGKVSRQLFS